MQKDIQIPTVKDVHIVAIREWDEDFLNRDWNVHLINGETQPLEMVFVVSRGYDNNRKTATLRHAFATVAPFSSVKIELVTEDVLSFTNEFLLTYYIGNTLYDKKFVFAPHTISEQNCNSLPVIDREGVAAE